jgi:cation/acetate symporter
MVGLAFAIAASANFPALLLSITFKRFTTRGAVASMLTGTFSSLTAILLSPTVMVDIFHAESALMPLKNPGIITVPLSFLAGIVVSLRWPEPAALARFAETEARMHLGAEPTAPAHEPAVGTPTSAPTHATAH